MINLEPDRHMWCHERKERGTVRQHTGVKTKGCSPTGTMILQNIKAPEAPSKPLLLLSPTCLHFAKCGCNFFPFDAVPEDHLISIKMLYNSLKTDNLHHMVSILCPLWNLSSLKLDSLSLSIY